MKKIFIVRHGKTQWNQEGKIQGANGDPPLLNQSIKDAQDTGFYLKNFGIDLIFASPLSRSLKTAELIAKSSGFKGTISLIEDLKEVGFGSWEGKLKDDLVISHPTEFQLMKTRTDDNLLVNLGFETFEQAGNRFTNSVYNLANQLLENQNGLIVSHGAVIQLGLKKILNTNNIAGIKNTAVTSLSINDNQILLETFNEVGFLQDPANVKEIQF
ncbi:MAG: phosphoglycerate mutase family protein [Lactobacillaceae bacterium]|jgi:probable phosphoglycerate mutase|nr:phosphoglycerate mutase family protein [Lactobacillaceae bacterium]